MNTYGERVKVTIFGESHGPAIGVVLDGVPAGEAVDMDAVRIQMRRRAPGSSDLTTHRSETDDPLVMSGILNGVTTGAPISAIFRNKDQNSAAYHPEIPAPEPRGLRRDRALRAATPTCAAAARSAAGSRRASCLPGRSAARSSSAAASRSRPTPCASASDGQGAQLRHEARHPRCAQRR